MKEKLVILEVLKAYKKKIINLEEDYQELRKVLEKQDKDIEYLSRVLEEIIRSKL